MCQLLAVPLWSVHGGVAQGARVRPAPCPGCVSKARLSSSRRRGWKPVPEVRGPLLGGGVAPSWSWRQFSGVGEILAGKRGEGKVCSSVSQHVLYRGARTPPPPAFSAFGDGAGWRGSLAPGLRQSAGRRVPRGSDCVPPAGDCVGLLMNPINGVKAGATLSSLLFCWK